MDGYFLIMHHTKEHNVSFTIVSHLTILCLYRVYILVGKVPNNRAMVVGYNVARSHVTRRATVSWLHNTRI